MSQIFFIPTTGHLFANWLLNDHETPRYRELPEGRLGIQKHFNHGQTLGNGTMVLTGTFVNENADRPIIETWGDLFTVKILQLERERIKVTIECMVKPLLPYYQELIDDIRLHWPNAEAKPPVDPIAQQLAPAPAKAAQKPRRGGPTPNFSKEDRRKIAEGWLKAKANGGVLLRDYAAGNGIVSGTVLKYVKQLEAGELED